MKRIFLSFALLLFSALPAFAAETVMSLTVDHGSPLSLSSPASSVFVANPDIADVQVLSPTQIMLFGKRTGETTFMATDSKGNILAERTLVVAQDLGALRGELRSAIPGNDISAKPVPGGIILTGTARDPVSVADAYKIAMRYLPSGGDIINRVQVTGSNQIHIRVRFAEVQRSIDNSMGFNWQNLLTASGNLTIGLATGSAIGTAANIIGTRPSNTSLSTPNDVLGVGAKIGKMSVNGVIDALAQEGLLTILAEPNLTAMSGETANFLAGGEFPIPVPQSNGTISIQFQSYGISLAFTPTVLSGDRISLHVRPEVSELTDVGSIVSSNITVPALTSRKAETTVEVASGESFAIAGLMNNSQSQTINKFPMLGDLPILGALFRSDHFVNGQTELVVIITPYIVKPSKKQLALPTDGYSPPSERERYVGLRTSSGDPDARPVSGEPVGIKVTAPAPAPLTPVPAAPAQDKGVKAVPAVQPQTETKVAPVSSSTPPAPTQAAQKPVAPMPAPVVVSAPIVKTVPSLPPPVDEKGSPSTSNLLTKSQVEETPSVSAPASSGSTPKAIAQKKETKAAPAPKKVQETKAAAPASKAQVQETETTSVPLSTSNLLTKMQLEQKSPVSSSSTTPAAKAPVKKKENTSSSTTSPVSSSKSGASSATTKTPLVLRAPGDATKQGGGLIVE